MKRSLPLILFASFGVATAASAQQTPAPADPATTAATAAGDRADDSAQSRHCLRDTGSRITAAANDRQRRAGEAETHCANSPGHSYSKQDIDRTGETDTAAALRKLDPSLR